MSAIGSGHPGLGLPKGIRRRDEKKADDREHGKQRAACLAIVRKRDGYACRCCGYKGPSLHGHEIKPRSLGGSDTDTANVVLLCGRSGENCHLWAVHGKRLRIVGSNANEPLLFVRVR